ncbi:MAG: chromosome segregation protein SMC [Thermoanaerobaculia bacterium]
MFHLESLSISGFKSFSESAHLAFPGAITAVIGPNGCGKSNICDAVAWALGEQSARILRGEKMDDVIFNGSGKRRPLGMAEVTLTLRSNNGDFPENDGRVAIGRRVYREGEGEYFLNGRKVRLKDVQDVLFGTGLGVRAYSIIEQGKIDQVLSSKPLDRRKLIEEAAGITKYKIKKRSAELKLEETRANLTRLSDILAEVERSCASLKRQASKAERYKEKTAALRAARTRIARLRFDSLQLGLGRAEAELGSSRDEEAGRSADLSSCEAAEAEARRVALDARGRRDAAREDLSLRTSAVERDDSAIEAARRAEVEIAARQHALTRDSEELTRETAKRRDARAATVAACDQRRSELEAARAAKEAATESKRSTEERIRGVEDSLEKVRLAAASLSGERAQARNERHQTDLALERIAAARSRIAETRRRLDDSIASIEAEVSESGEENRRVSERAAECAAASDRNGELLQSALKDVAELEDARGGLRERLAAEEQQLRALEEQKGSIEQGARRVLEHLRSRGERTDGVVASKLVPKQGWEGILDRIATEELEAVVVDGDGFEVAARLRDAGAGGTVFGSVWPRTAEAGGWERVLENFHELSPALLSILPPVLFVETSEEAREAARSRPGVLIACRSGEIVRGALWRVPGPQPEAAGPLSLRREIEDVHSSLETLRRELEGCESRLSAARSRRSEHETLAATLGLARRDAETAAAAHSARHAERVSELERQRREHATLRTEDEMLEQDSTRLSESRAEILAKESRLEQGEIEQRGISESCLQDLAQLRPRLASELENEAGARETLEGARERLASAERELFSLSSQDEAATKKKAEWEKEAEALGERLATAGREAEQARQRRDENVLAREGAARSFESLSVESENLALAAAEAEDAVKRVRELFDAARQKRFDAEILHARIASDLGHAVEDSQREFGVSPSELPPSEPLTDEERDRIEQEARELADQIERMGPVNVLAFEEYREQSDRLEFLTAQRLDIESSIASLLDTIRKINATSSERFAEAFAVINRNFAELFQRLFRGGSAEMRLLDESDLLDSGIEITAQPPGKRNQSILLLSGGEKAMTAIALLMGIFRYKPSPFCILDEVDAPLDDANIDRFAQLIREMSEDTQFIAITHNKRTMEAADALYGVTMEEPGCSKIVSVKFD